MLHDGFDGWLLAYVKVTVKEGQSSAWSWQMPVPLQYLMCKMTEAVFEFLFLTA